MKRLTLIFLLFLFNNIAGFCQRGDTTWFDISWNECTKKNASFYRPPSLQTDSGYWIKDYYLSGKLQYQCLSTDSEKEDYVGTATWYNENGKITSTREYRQIQKEGELKEFFDNGQLRTLSHFKNWHLTDTSYVYYVDGVLRAKYSWQDGKLDGPFVIYHENGTLSQRAFFKDNLLDKTFEEYYWPGAGYARKEDVPKEAKDRLLSRMTFSNGVTNGPATRWTAEGDITDKFEFQNNKPTGYCLRRKENDDTATYFRFLDGLLTGRFVDWSGGWHQQGLFEKGKPIRWRVTDARKLLSEANAVDDSIVHWKYYSKDGDFDDDHKLAVTGYSNNNKWHGDWIFYCNDGKKNKSYTLSGANPPMIQPRLRQGWLNIDMPDLFDESMYEYEFMNAIKNKSIISATYTAFDENGKIAVNGKYADGGPVGKWKYTNQRGQSIVVDVAKPLPVSQVLAFIQVRQLKRDDMLHSDRPYSPELVVVTKDDYGEYRFEVGELVTAACRKDKGFTEQLISKIISSAKLKNDAAQRKMIFERIQMQMDFPDVIRELVDESPNTIYTRVPILLKKEIKN